MSLTISSGGSGGVFGPNVYIGGMVGTWVAYKANKFIPGAALSPSAFALVGMAAVFAGTARVPIATLVMVSEMTGGYGLIGPSMLATTIDLLWSEPFRRGSSIRAFMRHKWSKDPIHRPIMQASFGQPSPCWREVLLWI
jgi:H+/Cl- antiporter ClcA